MDLRGRRSLGTQRSIHTGEPGDHGPARRGATGSARAEHSVARAPPRSARTRRGYEADTQGAGQARDHH